MKPQVAVRESKTGQRPVSERKATTRGQSALSRDLEALRATAAGDPTIASREIMIAALRAQLVIDRCGTETARLTIQSAEERTGVASRILNAAKNFKVGKQFNLPGFLAWCKEHEDWVTSDAAGRYKTATIPKVWSDAKSIIKRAVEKSELNPLDFTSVAMLKQKHLEIGKQKKATGGLSGELVSALSEVYELLDVAMRTVMEESLGAVLTQFNEVVASQNQTKQ